MSTISSETITYKLRNYSRIDGYCSEESLKIAVKILFS